MLVCRHRRHQHHLTSFVSSTTIHQNQISVGNYVHKEKEGGGLAREGEGRVRFLTGIDGMKLAFSRSKIHITGFDGIKGLIFQWRKG